MISLRITKLRTIVGPGAGYQVWDDPVKFLLFEAGVSYANVDHYEGKDKDYVNCASWGRISLQDIRLPGLL